MFDSPLIAAPMAGGTTTSALLAAAQAGGALGFLAGGYKSAGALREQIAAARAGGGDFGVNLFVPRAGPLDAAGNASLAAYRAELEGEAGPRGVELPRDFGDLSDDWAAKVELLVADPVPYVSFTFGLPPRQLVDALHRAGSRVLASVTSPAEALVAAGLGVDALVVQHSAAGGHSAAFLPPGPADNPAATAAGLVAAVRAAVALPLVAAGGIGDAAAAKAVLAAGAQAAQLGTALLRTPESGARPLHKDALADPAFTGTALTRAFTGKPARALVNDFVRRHSGAPEAYPEIHFLTTGIRAAAAEAGDAQAVNLWAGTAWRMAQALPAAQVIAGFLKEL